jgi:hypothetical protein
MITARQERATDSSRACGVRIITVVGRDIHRLRITMRRIRIITDMDTDTDFSRRRRTWDLRSDSGAGHDSGRDLRLVGSGDN